MSRNAKIIGALLSAFVALGVGIFTVKDAPGRTGLRDSYRRPAAVPYPDDNPYSAAKHDLGRTLFFDTALSGPRTRSCGSCHDPALAWGDGRARAQGEKELPLRSPTLIDIAWIPKFGWDGKFRDLEAVAFGPITSPANMDFSEAGLVERLAADPVYVEAFT